MRLVSISLFSFGTAAAVASSVVTSTSATTFDVQAPPRYVRVPPYAARAFPYLVKRPARREAALSDSTAATLLVPLNHSSSSKTQDKIALRYWLDGSCYTKGGPVFVHLGGEGEQGPVPCGSRERVFGALSLSVEHRFYGKSHVANKTVAESLDISYLQQ